MTTTKRKLLTAEDLLELDGKGIKGELIRGGILRNRVYRNRAWGK